MGDLMHHNSGLVIPRAEYEAETELLASLIQAANEAITKRIERIDFEDGDADLEEDDPSGQCDEDGINTSLDNAVGGGPGCDIADPGGCEHDGREPHADSGICPEYGIDQTKAPPGGWR